MIEKIKFKLFLKLLEMYANRARKSYYTNNRSRRFCNYSDAIYNILTDKEKNAEWSEEV